MREQSITLFKLCKTNNLKEITAPPMLAHILLGVGIGAALGVAMSNMILGMGIGVAIGLVMGIGTEIKKRKSSNNDS